MRIAYPKAEKLCEGGGPYGLDPRFSRRCAHGWVDRQWVDILSG